jgi:DNA-binding MarR family transcriptional regulator
MPEPVTETAGELMRVIAGLRRVARRRTAVRLGTPPLPEAQRELLFVVERQPGIGVAAAASELGLAGNSVSTLVNALVGAGLLHRGVDPDDRRAARLTLASVAHQRLEAWRSARSALVGEALERVAEPTRGAITTALPALRLLLAELREGENR